MPLSINSFHNLLYLISILHLIVLLNFFYYIAKLEKVQLKSMIIDFMFIL